MTAWTEQTLRTAASWQAFKEGKSLVDRGAVTHAAATANGWMGTIAAGKRPIRVRVIAISATHLETHCSCPENRATGALCAHAVATGLATLMPATPSAPVAATPPANERPTARAFAITLPANWLESLRRGRLSATLADLPAADATTADHRIATWLTQQGAKPTTTQHLHLDGPRTASFLRALEDHPAVTVGNQQSPVRIASGHRMQLATATRLGECVQLQPSSDATSWLILDDQCWQCQADAILRLGSDDLPASLQPILTALANQQSVEVPIQPFLKHLLTWQDWLSFPENPWLDDLHFLPADAQFQLALDGSLQEMHAHLRVAYDDAAAVSPTTGDIAHLPRLDGNRCWVRNLDAEQSACQSLLDAGFQPPATPTAPWSLRGESTIISFLTRSLPALRNRWSITESARFLTTTSNLTIVSPHIEILGSGEDWLGFNLSFQSSDGIRLPSDDVRRMIRSGRSLKQPPGHRKMVISESALEWLEPLFSELDLRQVDGHYEASAAAGEVIREIRNNLENPLTPNHQAKPFPFHPPATLTAQLRPYQAAGSGWLADRLQRFGGALLADDMGLGKTIQTIALIEHLFASPSVPSGVILIIATASLLGNWRAEFARFAPARRVHVLHGSQRDQTREQIEVGDVIITSFGTLARDLAWHLKHDYLAVVVDEASLMRNPDTDHAKAVAKLRSRHRVALTGTPVENSVRDLWAIFRFIQPGWLGSRQTFKDLYEIPLQSGETAPSVMQRLKLKTQPFLLRRTKQQVAPDLPSKLIIDEFCDLSADQQSVYRELLIEGRKRIEAITDAGNSGAARMHLLTTLLRLRQTCCDLALLGNDSLKQLLVARRSSKLERLLELLEEALEGGHKVLVFSQFQQQLVAIEQSITERGWASQRLDGQTRNRQSLVDRFQAPDGPPIFLISLKAGGYGLNLTAADMVIHFDPWWNPAAEAQATDRTHRIGQTRPVTVYRLLTRGTVEEKVVRLQARKRDLAASIEESGTGDAPAWNMADFKEVLA